MTSKHWLALGVLGSGAIGLLSTYLYFRGRKHEAFALGTAATITSTVFAAARILQEDESAPRVVRVDPSDLDIGPVEVSPVSGARAVYVR